MAAVAAWQLDLGRALVVLRDARKLTQRQVADHIRTHLRDRAPRGIAGVQTVQRLERGGGVNTNYVAHYLDAVGAQLVIRSIPEGVSADLAPAADSPAWSGVSPTQEVPTMPDQMDGGRTIAGLWKLASPTAQRAMVAACAQIAADDLAVPRVEGGQGKG